MLQTVQGIEMGWKKPSDAIFYESKEKEARISVSSFIPQETERIDAPFCAFYSSIG
jgi:hypothetical protein